MLLIRNLLLCVMLLGPVASSTALAQSGPDRVPLPIPRPAVAPAKPATATVKTKARIYQVACPVVLSGKAVGKIGTPIKAGRCGTQSPYKITAVKLKDHVVKFSSPALFNCSMATAFVDWVEKLNEHSVAQSGAIVSKIDVGTSYACRRRNNQKTGKISEHGFANAVDVTGFELGNGAIVALPPAWKAKDGTQQLIKTSHKLACEIFTTVLGPDANSLHYDHLHFDMGCHGKTCTYKVCD